jgi:Homeodomain-like domain
MTKKKKKAPRAKPKARRAAPRSRQPGDAFSAVGVGRPTSYRPECADQAKKLCELGATDADIAAFFGVSDRTIYRWQTAHPEFCQALKAGKAPADDRVERSLFHRAVGYSHDAVKIMMPAGFDEPVYAHYRKHEPPDTVAAIFWLKNRRPDLWRDRHEVDLGNKDGKPFEVKAATLSDDELAAIAASGAKKTK